MNTERVQLYCFDWEDDRSFEGFLKEKEINERIYSILECIARQGIMEFGGYEFDNEPANPDLALQGNDFDAYISSIQSHIAQVERVKKESFEKTLSLVDELNTPSEKRWGSASRGENPLILLNRKTADGKWDKPTYFMRYGMEKLIFGKIIKDMESIIPAEANAEDEINEAIALGLWRGRLKVKYVKTMSDWFSSGSAVGKYLTRISRTFSNPKNPKVIVVLHPDKEEFFKVTIAAYYSVFHSYLYRESESRRADFRSGFDKFVAEKLRYMCAAFSERLAEYDYDLHPLFDREVIKDRIRNNQDFADNFKAQMEASGLINKPFIEHLARRFP